MSVKQSEFASYSIRTAVAVALGTVAMMASAPRVLAADAAAGPQPTGAASAAPVLEEVTVTGSRIKRKDLESNSPLVTVDSEAIEQRAGLNLESYLNNMPNYNPAQTPTTGEFDVQPSAVNTVGISTISLRGLGPNRSLVLIDGHRTTPINALMVTDINGIPAAMIDRVEIITGGASTAYGADAISGVTNFILKKDIQGLIVDAQDSITQAGDGNQLDVSALMGTKFADGKGHMSMGMEYYNRQSAAARNRDFFTNGWNDPNDPQSPPPQPGSGGAGSNAFFFQQSGFAVGVGSPTSAAFQTIFPKATINPTSGVPQVCAYPQSCVLNNFYFNNNGSVFTNTGPVANGNYTGPTSGGGYGLYNTYDPGVANSASTPPGVVQEVKWNNPLALVSEPQTRYSFFANGDYDLTDKIQFYSSARYATSLTATLLPTPTTGTFGWEAQVPFNAATDSPILPSAVTPATTQAQLQQIYNAFAAGTPGAYANPTYVAPGGKGQGHPVPWQLAMLLLSRQPPNGLAPGLLGGAVACDPTISAAVSINCPGGPQAAQSWIVNYLPQYSALQRSTVDQSSQWQIETGIKFPVMVGDWTGDLYYSRGQSTNYENGYGSDSLQRYRAVVDSPGYGQGQSFQGNANGASTNFGTSVPTTCTTGFYNTFFMGDQSASADCMTAIQAPLQTFTAMQQDIVEANFQGTLFKLPAGDVSAAVGYQYRRDAAQFVPDNLQATYSFLDQTIGLYPLGTVNNELSSRDGYAEIYIPVLSDLPGVQKLNLDIGGRYSSFSVNIPSATTYKFNLDWQVIKQIRIRGGYNRATRAPNLGELYLGTQEYFGGGAQFGDPCSVRSPALYGAGGADNDYSASSIAGPTHLGPGQTAAGALSTYLICQAQMSAAGARYYYGAPASAPGGAALGNTNQSSAAAPAAFAWLNESGSTALTSETADTWTGGLVFSNLGDSPWISGLTAEIDWWQIDIKHAIGLESPDYVNYLCYGVNQVTNAAQAAAAAATAACENVGRNQTTGGGTVSTLAYNNLGTVGIQGIDLQLNWFAQLADLGLKVPGGVSFSTQDTMLDYYKTKQSPQAFDVDVNWKDSLGPTLAGTNPGAYGYRLTANIGYVLPSFTMNLYWQFYPSVHDAAYSFQQAVIKNNQAVAGGAPGTLLGYTPNTNIATPAWSAFDLSFSWNINTILSVRGGIQNLFNKEPPIVGAYANYPVGTNLNGVCGSAPGCQNPTAYTYPVDGAGNTNSGFYADGVYGRTFFVGLKARF